VQGEAVSYLESLAHGAVFAAALFMGLVAIGAAVKVTQWIGKRLGVKPLDL
jgi:hypothetical protein